MELILNDFSLDGQFKRVEDFADYIRDVLAPLLDVIVENQMKLLKKSDFYNAVVTAELSLNDLMMMANEPAISLLKRYIVNLGYCGTMIWRQRKKFKEACDMRRGQWALLCG